MIAEVKAGDPCPCGDRMLVVTLNDTVTRIVCKTCGRTPVDLLRRDTDPPVVEVPVLLFPVEQIALTVARRIVDRGEPIPPNTALMLLATLDRIAPETP